MEEIKENKEVKIKQTSKTKKVPQTMTVLTASTIREIVRTVNKEEIQKDNIVSLLRENGQFILVYYK